jgi:hypothetical protein
MAQRYMFLNQLLRRVIAASNAKNDESSRLGLELRDRFEASVGAELAARVSHETLVPGSKASNVQGLVTWRGLYK